MSPLDQITLQIVRETARQAVRELLEQIRKKGPPVQPLTLNTSDAARYCGLSPSKLSRLRHGGRGPPFVRIDACVRFRRADLDRWLEQQTIKGE